MAQARRHSGAGTFTGFLLTAVVVLALLIGWALWAGVTPELKPQVSNIELPRAPKLPATPNPEPLPIPGPGQPG